MNDSDLYRYTVGWATSGGLLIGLVGLIYQIVARASSKTDPVPAKQTAFHDLRIIYSLSCAPQLAMLTLPVLYPSPQMVPGFLTPAAVFATAALVCIWLWALVKMFRAGWPVRIWYSRVNFALFCAPLLISGLAIVLVIMR